MEIPVIDLSALNDERRCETMALLQQACERCGCFQVENHGIDNLLMEKVKELVKQHYEEHLKEEFYQSEIASSLAKEGMNAPDTDWETTFFVWHRPTSNINQMAYISKELSQTMEKYIGQLVGMAEKLSELISENLGLEKEYIKKTFFGTKGPCVGTKVAIYPQCPKPEVVRGLREHTDAGGIILLLQDDQVPGLEFLKDGQWVKIPPSKNNTIFVNTGDQVEVLSNGKYRSFVHRVLADKNGSRVSIATFYNPAADAMIAPAPGLVYPHGYCFQDYLKLYNKTKFGDKESRFQLMKKMTDDRQHTDI